MKLSDQALGAIMMALQKSLMEQSDIVPTLRSMNFVKSETPDPIEEINFHDLLKEICNNSKIKNKKIDLKINKKIKSSGRPLQLRRCFVNLIENAIRYSEKIIVELNVNDENIIINISDNGPGIPQSKYDDPPNLNAPKYRRLPPKKDNPSTTSSICL